MRVLERVPLAELTTFKVGGPAQVVVECGNQEEVQAALALSRERGLPHYVLGGGSNVVAPDDGYKGVIIAIKIPGVVFETNGDETIAVVGAGVVWDEFVRMCTERGLWGVENLAGIPGSVGAAPVQNIGAYGVELASCLEWVEICDIRSSQTQHLVRDECQFGYRDSMFKHKPELIILQVAFKLSTDGTPHTTYADIARRIDEGATLDSPTAIADVVRDIRSRKFPDLRISGTAGSFFKNPMISNKEFAHLKETYPELPGFLAAESTTKISLAWILDHVLHLRGFAMSHVRLFENQPLVIASEPGATSAEIEALAREVEKRVLDAMGIMIEREVRMLQ